MKQIKIAIRTYYEYKEVLEKVYLNWKNLIQKKISK